MYKVQYYPHLYIAGMGKWGTWLVPLSERVCDALVLDGGMFCSGVAFLFQLRRENVVRVLLVGQMQLKAVLVEVLQEMIRSLV